MSVVERVRRAVGDVGPVRSTWRLASAVRGGIADSSRRNRRRVQTEFATADPWSYATSAAEQDCFRHQLAVLDRARDGRLFGETCEIGCAEGFFTEPLADRCESLLALELSPTALARARDRREWGAHVRFASWDLRADPFPGHFDLIVIAGVLEYLERPSALRAAREKIVLGLRPGGRLFLVSTRSPGSEESWWARALPRGARINEYVGRHDSLRPCISESGEDYVIDLFEKVG